MASIAAADPESSAGKRAFDVMYAQQHNLYYDPPSSPRRRTAWLVPLFVVANVVVFVVAMYYNDCPSHPNRYTGRCVGESLLKRFSFQPLRENPLYGPSSRTMKRLGALEWDRVVNQHQGWRLITCIWLHAGLIHLFVNMLSLVLIGLPLEKHFGFIRIGIIYLLSGLGGSILSSLFTRYSVSVGASGALFGLLGSILSELITNWSLYSNKVSTLFSLLIIVLVNLAVGLLPHIDNFAHIGGFITGFFLGFVLLLRPQFAWITQDNHPSPSGVASKYKAYQLVLFVMALLLVIAEFIVTLVMLFRRENANNHCSWCHYLNCIPTSRWDCTNG